MFAKKGWLICLLLDETIQIYDVFSSIILGRIWNSIWSGDKAIENSEHTNSLYFSLYFYSQTNK